MTNAPEGRTYIDYSWDIRPGARQYFHVNAGWTYGDNAATLVETPHLIPNGMWVVEFYFYGQPVGVERSDLTLLEYTTKDGGQRQLYHCDRPFGLVTMDSEGRRRLNYARKIWKGELSRGVHTPTLDYVREPLPPHRGRHMKARERRRGQRGWVKLADLGEMSSCGYRPDKQVELILGYWQFSGHRNYRFYENDQDGGQLVDVAWGSSLDIEDGTAEFKSLTREQFREECADTSEVWVRRGFAFTILRLLALGVQPEVLQPA